MSNKNIVLPKYKWQPEAQHNRPVLNPVSYKQERKIHIQYSPKNLPNQSPKYFKQSSINRHYSQQQFKRFPILTQNQSQPQPLSAQQQYYPQIPQSKYVHQSRTAPTNNQHNNVSRNMITFNTKQANNNNVQSSTQNHHSNNRRVSPSSSPAFFKSKPKLIIKDNNLGKISRDNFKFLNKLGEGKFGKVFLVREINTGFVMAMKVLEKKKIIQDNILEQFIRQLKIQAFLNHPNIIDVYGFFHDEHYFYTLLELGCDGQLYNIIAQHKNLTEQATSFITKNLLQAVNCMHQNQILHRDIKPQNIVLIMGNVKLCDFGWAVNKVKKEELRSTFCGTPLYLSPELLKGQKYDEKVDLWAIGILAYELLIGSSPFQINEQQDLIKILTQQVRFPKNRKISSQFQQFIQHILNKNPKERLPSSDLLKLSFIRKYEQFQTCQELCN